MGAERTWLDRVLATKCPSCSMAPGAGCGANLAGWVFCASRIQAAAGAEDDCVRCWSCKKCAGACDCTGGPVLDHECTCYELTGGHQPGCYFNRHPWVRP